MWCYTQFIECFDDLSGDSIVSASVAGLAGKAIHPYTVDQTIASRLPASSYLAPANGVLNVWVGSAVTPEAARPVTNDTERGIRFYGWAYTNDHIIYFQDKGGDEQWQVYSVDLSNGETRNLTPFEGISASIGAMSHKYPDDMPGLLHKA